MSDPSDDNVLMSHAEISEALELLNLARLEAFESQSADKRDFANALLIVLQTLGVPDLPDEIVTIH